MRPRILSVSYDLTLLRTRQMLLEQQGYDAISSASIDESLQTCRQGHFDLLIVGHSIPADDKQHLMEEFRLYCSAPVIFLRRSAGDEFNSEADYDVGPEPEPLLKLVHTILTRKSRPHGSGARP